MHRFFAALETLQTKDVLLTGDTAHQITRVLRMRPGDEVVLLDGQGYEYLVSLSEFGKEDVQGVVLRKSPGIAEPVHGVDIYLSLLNKPDKFEWALQKCVELGAASFTPVVSERGVPGPPEKGRRERWERIIKEAAEQSGRTVLPPLGKKLSLKEALQIEESRLSESEGAGSRLAIMPAPGADKSLADALSEEQSPVTVSLFIGPEGGFSEDELWEANERGVVLVNLGPRILRAETAAVAALAALMYALGEMGGSL